MRRTPSRTRALAALLAAAAAAVLVGAQTAPVEGAPAAPLNAYYAPGPAAPQSRSVAAFRQFLSSQQPRYGMQSFPFFGSLIDDRGRTTTFSLMMQQQQQAVTVLGVQLPAAVEGVMFNAGSGFTAGGVIGVPELTFPLTVNAHPWSVRAQSVTVGSQPQFVDARVVSGHVGEAGAVYELTSDVTVKPLPNGKPYVLQVYVRAKDTLGMVQWGYGPSGFFPQWILPAQRAAIVGRYHGDVEAYLAATRTRMTGQGDYYYSAPLLSVQEYAFYAGGRQISHGRKGVLWLDNVEQSFDAAAQRIVTNGVTWTEFSTQLTGIRQALKVGWVHQRSVGTLSYAMLATARDGRFVDGNLATTKWSIPSITVEAVPGRQYLWRSPATGLTYHTCYRVVLRKAGNRKGHSASLIMTAVFPAQEVSFGAKKRAVYEGLFRVSGVLDGRTVSGQAWGEIQPASSL